MPELFFARDVLLGREEPIMFCDLCGKPLAPGAQFCSYCGKSLMAGTPATISPVVSAAGDGRVQRNINLLAGLWMATGILRFAEVGWMLLFGKLLLPSMMGALGAGSVRSLGSWPLDGLMARGLYFAGMMLAFFGVAHLVLAWGLYERQQWARIFGLVIGFLALLRIPFGTALGIYTIWVLLPEESGREYDQLCRAY
jgi:zinc ribbon protein